MKKIQLTILFAFMTVLILSGQKSIIRGKVLDTDNKPLPGANIFISDLKKGTASDINGNFELTVIPEGNHNLEVSYIGYKTISREIAVSKDTDQEFLFHLDAGIDLDEVVISERLVGESKALNTQRTNINISNIVSFEQIERFPDANIGDALKRLTGINVMNDQGEARFAVIRGTQPELNSVTINGERIPSAEAEKRYVQLDLVPSDMVQTIEVNKALTPDMDADAIGGSINLITKTAPGGHHLSGTAGTGYNFISGKLIEKGNVTYSNRLAKGKIGVVLGASVFNNPMESHDIEGEWDYAEENDKDGTAYLSDFEVRQYFVTRIRQSYMLSSDYEINNNHTLLFSGIYNWRNDFENRYRLQYKGIEWNDDEGSYVGEVIRQLKAGSENHRSARLEDQRMINFRLGGAHRLGILNADWSAAWSRASEERPNERYLGLNAEDILISMPDLYNNQRQPLVVPHSDFSDYNNGFDLDELTEEYQLTKETDKNFSLNFELPLVEGKLKFGGRFRDKYKTRENDFYEYEPVEENTFMAEALAAANNFSDNNFFAGNYLIGSFPRKEFIGTINFNDSNFDKEQVIEEMAGNFTASEKVIAGYAMFSRQLFSGLSLLAGVRVENTIIDYKGFEHFIDENDEREEWLEETDAIKENYRNILPAIHLKFSPHNNLNIRLAWTNTLARPNYFDLVPYREINADDSELALGNSELLPTNSMNFDFLAEYFFDNIGLLSGGVFYKKLDNIIAMTIDDNYQFYHNGSFESFEMVQPKNVGNGILIGIEGTFSRRLTFLPSFLSNLSFYANYSYNYSKLTDVFVEGRENEDLQIPGSPKHMLNLSMAYDIKRFDFRISYNYASAFRDGVEGGYGEEAFYDRWYDKVNNLDLNTNISISNKLKVYLDIINILNQPLRYYQGVTDRTMQAEYYGLRIKTGIKFDF